MGGRIRRNAHTVATAVDDNDPAGACQGNLDGVDTLTYVDRQSGKFPQLHSNDFIPRDIG
jgi:hypothetical protein